jgi:Protein of unknown function (DUF3106)
MPGKTLQAASLLLATVLLSGAGAFARQNPRTSGPAPTQQPAANAERPQLPNLPPGWIKRLQEMTPAEQQKFLKNNARFRKLPPERRAEIRHRLRQWNRLTPEERQAVLDRQRVWEKMTPKQRRYVRETLLPQWRSLAADRRQILLRKLHALRNLDDAQRAAKLNDESFLAGLNPDERQMLRNLSNLRIAAASDPASSTQM